MKTLGLIIRVKGSPRVASIPLIFVYAASADLRGNISTIVCCNFRSQSAEKEFSSSTLKTQFSKCYSSFISGKNHTIRCWTLEWSINDLQMQLLVCFPRSVNKKKDKVTKYLDD